VLPIAIDVMSGDQEPREYVAGALRALADDAGLRVRLVGDSELIGALLAAQPAALRARVAVLPATEVVTMEEKPREAIRRSIQLSKDSRGRIFMLGLLALIIQLGLTGITQGFFLVVGIKHHGVLPVWMSVVQQFLAFLTNTFVGPIYATGFTLFYYDQRVRKEGYDIERMMHTAGMTESEPALESGSSMSEVASLEGGSGHE